MKIFTGQLKNQTGTIRLYEKDGEYGYQIKAYGQLEWSEPECRGFVARKIIMRLKALQYPPLD